MWTASFRTMGCQARVLVDADDPVTRRALEGVPAWFADRERRLSRFDPKSALSRLNARGTCSPVDEVLWAALDAALAAAEHTGGLVTPTVCEALEAAGYRTSFERLDRDQAGPLAPTGPAADWRTIRRDPATRAVRLPRGVRLDLGGTAKGWCADIAADGLARLGPALVDLGGDIAIGGQRREPWPIAVEDPRGGPEPLAILQLRRGAVATSGRDFRRWRRSGVEQHHLIDPRTGLPARTDVVTATVVAPRALDAEVAAKRVLLEGSQEGMSWIESTSNLAAMLVRDDGRVLRSARWARHAWRHAA